MADELAVWVRQFAPVPGWHGVLVVPTSIVGEMIGRDLAVASKARWYRSKRCLKWDNDSWLLIATANEMLSDVVRGLTVDGYMVVDPASGFYRTVEGGIEDIEMQLQNALRRTP